MTVSRKISVGVLRKEHLLTCTKVLYGLSEALVIMCSSNVAYCQLSFLFFSSSVARYTAFNVKFI